MDLRTRRFERILLIKPSSLGDIVHALPVLHGLRDRYPDARVSWLVSTEYESLLQSHPLLDEVIGVDLRAFKSVRGSLSMAGEVPRLARLLRSRRYDLAIDLQGLLRSGLLAWASGAPVRLGFRPAREGAGLFYTHRIAVPAGEMHAVDRNYLVANILGFETSPVQFDLPVQPEARAAVVAKLSESGVAEGERYAVVIPGSRWETKNWPIGRFAEVVDRIQAEMELKVVLSGGSAEKGLCAELVRKSRDAPADLTGRINLAELVALLDGAELILCNDSAPLHIGVARGRPVVSIFGPTNPNRTGPYGAAGRVVQAELFCIPCYYRRLSQCPYDHRCMAEVTVEGVVRTVAGALPAR